MTRRQAQWPGKEGRAVHRSWSRVFRMTSTCNKRRGTTSFPFLPKRTFLSHFQPFASARRLGGSRTPTASDRADFLSLGDGERGIERPVAPIAGLGNHHCRTSRRSRGSARSRTRDRRRRKRVLLHGGKKRLHATNPPPRPTQPTRTPHLPQERAKTGQPGPEKERHEQPPPPAHTSYG